MCGAVLKSGLLRSLKVSIEQGSDDNEALPFYDRIAGEEISRIQVLLHRSTYKTWHLKSSVGLQ